MLRNVYDIYDYWWISATMNTEGLFVYRLVAMS